MAEFFSSFDLQAILTILVVTNPRICQCHAFRAPNSLDYDAYVAFPMEIPTINMSRFPIE